MRQCKDDNKTFTKDCILLIISLAMACILWLITPGRPLPLDYEAAFAGVHSQLLHWHMEDNK